MTVVEPTPVPSPYDVRSTLSGLFAGRVGVRPADPYAPEPGQSTTYAVYVDERLRTRAVAVTDLRFSAYAGAALRLVPPTVADDSVARGVLDGMLAENLHEVLDACTSTLNRTRTSHVRLHAVYAAGSVPPADVVGYASVPARRLDLVVDLARYGTGRFSVVCVE